MIRRNEGDHWLLIEQAVHARLAGDIAAAWGGPNVAPVPNLDGLAEAITHHDDGWKEWDAAPQIDPVSGIPRDFTEMPMRDATAIWTRSIEICTTESRASGRWASEHFRWLARQAVQNRESHEDRAAAAAFIDEQLSLFPEQITRETDSTILPPDSGVSWLQLFDRLSLRLCCDLPPSPGPVLLPGGGTLTTDFGSPQAPVFEPFPFLREQVDFTVPARRVPARRYSTDAEFQEAYNAGVMVQIAWTIRRM